MLAYLFLAFAVAVRFMPHPWMFTPVTAALLFFGARGSKRQLWVPLVALVASDLILTKFVYIYPFSWDVVSSWVWYAAVIWLGTKLRDRAKPALVIGAALASSLAFFVVTNFAVWLVWNMYPKTLTGLLGCYVAGIPFFRSALEGDLLFTVGMFLTPVVAQVLSEKFSGASRPTTAA